MRNPRAPRDECGACRERGARPETSRGEATRTAPPPVRPSLTGSQPPWPADVVGTSRPRPARGPKGGDRPELGPRRTGKRSLALSRPDTRVERVFFNSAGTSGPPAQANAEPLALSVHPQMKVFAAPPRLRGPPRDGFHRDDLL